VTSSSFPRNVLFLVILGPATLASAQTPPAQVPHPRHAEVTFLMQAPIAVVLVSPTEAWAPQLPAEEPLSLCVSGHACVPVAARETCEVPHCPGAGARLVAAAPVADVDDFPESLDDWKEEIDALRADPTLAPLLGYVGAHPDANPPDVGWVTEENEDEPHLELRAGLLAGGLATQGAGSAGGELAVALRWAFHADSDSDDDDLDVLDTVLGDGLALELRASTEAMPDAQGDMRMATSVGAAFVASNVVDGGRFRVPTLMTFAAPEMGVFFRPDHAAAFYFRMQLPFAYAVSNGLAVEVRPSITLVDSWIEGDKAEVLFELSVSALLH